jgi:uncharacterized repeat protein (TIGR01451 family)
MKTILTRIPAKKLVLTSLFQFLIALFFLTNVSAQVEKQFTQRTAATSPDRKIYNIKGDFTMIGNTNMTLQNYTDDRLNSNNQMIFVDIDSDPTTVNSSSAVLGFSRENNADPLCSNIIYAGLYWTGRANTGDRMVSGRDKWSVKLKGPAASGYEVKTADANNIRFPNGSNDNMFVGYVEITDYVKNSAKGGLGSYTVADIAVSEGNGEAVGFYGGWGIVVVYENARMKTRDITLFDGFAYVSGAGTGNTFEFPLSGFQAVKQGDVNIKLGMMAGEGDVGILNDKFAIRNAANSEWVDLSHGTNATNNFFNSSIFIKSREDPAMDAVRNPNLKNNTGLDISMFNVPNSDKSIIANDQNSTRFRYSSGGDTYVIFNIVFSVDAYKPDIQAINTILNVNGTPYVSGTNIDSNDEVEYQVEVRNLGTEPIVNGTITIPIPYAASYVSATGVRNFSPASTSATPVFNNALGATGSIVWEVGTIPVHANSSTVLATLKYKLQATDNCYVLSNPTCLPSMVVDGAITGTGQVSQNSVGDAGHFITGVITGNCQDQPINDPVVLNINRPSSCDDSNLTKNFDFCTSASTIAVSSIRSDFPIGTRFYNQFPLTETSIEYTNDNPFPANITTTPYYAIPAGETGCHLEFSITITSNNSSPTFTDNYTYCQNEVATVLTATLTNDATTLFWYTDNAPETQPVNTITPSTSAAGTTIYYVAQGTSTCIGPKSPITVVVKPAPTANAVNNLLMCKEMDVAEIVLSGTATSFTWTNSNTEIGLAASGTGNIPAFTTINTTENDLIATIIVTPFGDDCMGEPMSFTITVNPCPLPVKLAGITAKTVENDVLIEWRTTEEVNFDHFEIQRSIDPKKGFARLATVLPTTKQGLGNYSYLDKAVQVGNTFYYRLKMVDRDATSAYSRIVSAKIDSDVITNIYPNPTKESLTVNTLQNILDVQIVNSAGKAVLTKSYHGDKSEVNIKLPNLPAGIYLIRIKTADQLTQYKKITID